MPVHEMSIELPEEYWALADSNADMTQPCYTFQSSLARVIQTSLPQPQRWKQWTKQSFGVVVFADVPRTLEILAIVYVICFDLANGGGLCRS